MGDGYLFKTLTPMNVYPLRPFRLCIRQVNPLCLRRDPCQTHIRRISLIQPT